MEGYIWAPKKNKSGHTRSHWTRVANIKVGDIIFSYKKKKIIAINKAITDGFEAVKHYGLDTENTWEKEGWKADINYNELAKPIELIEHKEIIGKYRLECGSEYAFDKNGEGKQGIFLKYQES